MTTVAPRDMNLPRDPSKLTSEMKLGLQERERLRAQISAGIDLIRLETPGGIGRAETCRLIAARCGLGADSVALVSGSTRSGHRPRLSTYRKVLKAVEEIRQGGGLKDKPVRRPLGISAAEFRGGTA